MITRSAARNIFRSSWSIAALMCACILFQAKSDPPADKQSNSQKSTDTTARSAGDNAAPVWQGIFTILRAADSDDKIDASGLTKEDWEVVFRAAQTRASPKDIERARFAMDKLQPTVDQILAASKLRKCEFEHDYSKGFAMELPELSPMRTAQRILNARASIALADGDWDTFLATEESQSNISKQVAQSPLLISSLVSLAVSYFPIQHAQQLVDEGSLTSEKAAQLLEKLQPLRGEDVHGFSNAMNEEYTVLVANSALDGKALLELAGPVDGINRLKNLDSAAILKLAQPLQGLYQEGAAAMLEPNKEAALKRWNAAMAQAQKLPRDTQVIMNTLMPALDKALSIKFENQTRCEALMLTLQSIASGNKSAGAFAVPAIWWSRAAAAARSLNDEQQAAVELLRLSSVTDNSPLLNLAIQTLDASDSTVFECMRRAMACESKVVSFEKISADKIPLNLALVGGLRGAARMALAKSMLPKWNAEQSLTLICMAIAASNALTSDPTFTHAVFSESIAEEIAVAVGHFSIRSGVSDALRANLDTAIATISRSDAFGFRAANIKTRSLLATRLRYEFGNNDDVLDDLKKSLAKKSMQWIFAVDVTRTSDVEPVAGPDGTLVSTDDVFTPDSVKEIGGAWKSVMEVSMKDQEKNQAKLDLESKTTTALPQRVQKFLNKINPPSIRDVSLDMNRTSEVLSTLDAAVAKRPL